MTAALSPAQPGGLDVPDLRLEVPPGATAAGAAARRGLRPLCAEADRIVLEHMRLLVDELVARAGRGVPGAYAPPLAVRVWVRTAVLRTEVGDGGFERGAEDALPARDGIDGRGLGLVDRLADRWGVSRPHPLAVWFELDRRSPS